MALHYLQQVTRLIGQSLMPLANQASDDLILPENVQLAAGDIRLHHRDLGLLIQSKRSSSTQLPADEGYHGLAVAGERRRIALVVEVTHSFRADTTFRAVVLSNPGSACDEGGRWIHIANASAVGSNSRACRSGKRRVLTRSSFWRRT